MNVVRSPRNPLGLVFIFCCSLLLGVSAFSLRHSDPITGGLPAVRRKVSVFAKPETVDRITGILATKFERDAKDIDPECKFLEEFDADNLDEVEVLLSIEEEFDLTIPDYDFAELRTVKAIADYIDRKLEKYTDN
ncbi:acyl carrier protein [Babesia ovis]|uniref:Acyl carrier protein n=1 Tax=Babesia ovis TaxID=5869 RepID=A0A9W5T9Q1_BABOV|nr:acyl carrier protein [Babesia ovis]